MERLLPTDSVLFLVNVAWQSAVLLGVALAAERVARRHATARHAILLSGLLAALGLPILLATQQRFAVAFLRVPIGLHDPGTPAGNRAESVRHPQGRRCQSTLRDRKCRPVRRLRMRWRATCRWNRLESLISRPEGLQLRDRPTTAVAKRPALDQGFDAMARTNRSCGRCRLAPRFGGSCLETFSGLLGSAARASRIGRGATSRCSSGALDLLSEVWQRRSRPFACRTGSVRPSPRACSGR